MSMFIDRQHLKVLSLILASALLLGAAADDLPLAVDLRADAKVARAERLPIVLFFYSSSCPFCREVEALYLKPLQKENLKSRRFLLRRVEIGERQALIDFTGTRTDFRSFAQQQKVMLVPHLRFVGPDGERLAADLIGLGSRDFYGGYLEDAINEARAKLRKPAG